MSSSLADFNSALDKLDLTGKNWLTFQQQFLIAVRQKKVWSHFNGMTPTPAAADPDKPTAAEVLAISQWQEKEDLALYLLVQKLPDVTFTKHRHKGNTAAIWAAIIQEFSQKSLLLRATLPLFGSHIPPGTSAQSPNTSISPSTLFDISDGARCLLEARRGRPDASRVDLGTSPAFGGDTTYETLTPNLGAT
ncbi:predicted protein [Postia placenta Mad-698-R]|uniref:Uncharacterized protein n=1 Tax=Postia placenta MAD-698-R-SB12 TaxID=670580 RepID=A0A1X6N2I9_9APHY|nr:hypothetical protein POSPLADRAFT_1141169 [Postia placenta MAD-698-R-SB12]EED82459.1 predicted protein [Postia placenta Mad-698-R]OSX62686.1 hypothetical protein POSPLADRAFT_1141169 [Postia placenta MAD-698-R-SB12]